MKNQKPITQRAIKINELKKQYGPNNPDLEAIITKMGKIDNELYEIHKKAEDIIYVPVDLNILTARLKRKFKEANPKKL